MGPTVEVVRGHNCKSSGFTFRVGARCFVFPYWGNPVQEYSDRRSATNDTLADYARGGEPQEEVCSVTAITEQEHHGTGVFL